MFQMVKRIFVDREASRACVIAVLAAFVPLSSPPLAAEVEPSAEFKQSARLDAIAPSGGYIPRGQTTVKVSFTFKPIQSEAIEYIGFLTVDGNPYGPLTFVITPSEATIKTDMRWYVRTAGQRASIRFRLIGIGNSLKTGYEFVDITKDYLLFRPPRRKKHYCRCR